MATSLRQRWDTINDRPDLKPQPLADQHRAWLQAISRPIPEFRGKLVRLAHGQTEISVIRANPTNVINARMGCNPLLDCPRKRRTSEEQAERDKENRQRAAKRARQNVRYLVKSAAADHLLTFSYRENVENRDKVARDWKEAVRLIRIRYPEWLYVAVLEKQERGAYHIHVAVNGKQDIKWLLRCWLLAIGQSREDIFSWLIEGNKLGEKSLGAVNVEPPKSRWGGGSGWKRNKLSGYLTKYIGKEFETAEKHSKKYWASRNIEKPKIERFWLSATNMSEAVREAFDKIYYTGATSFDLWGGSDVGVLWFCGETSRERIGQVIQTEPDF